ncbi:uncharacterized protein LOC133299316 [Gastrolobium bilobum]|uniref:uncharacterized protein LOC133299316 n=1 Tax=Gastrolobium bilobum TaxID=150636 RepID=UPI002AB02EAC|nr:uncharacterized protein LOC133299316 [Gastrolobium bilobum]
MHSLERGEISSKEADNLKRSKKKYKGGDAPFSHNQSMSVREEDWMKEGMSFKEMLMRHNGEWISEDEQNASEQEKEEMENESEEAIEKQPEVSWEMNKDGRTNFILSDAFKKKEWRPWNKAIYVKLLGKKLSLMFMNKKLKTCGLEKVRFLDKRDLSHALTAGPWVIFYHYLAIRSWELDFHPYQATNAKIMAWVRFSGFPIEYTNTKLLKRNGNWLGKFIKVDAATTSLARGRFARMCVKLDLTKSLQAEYKIEGKIKQVEYEGLHLVCYSCEKYGHKTEACPIIGHHNHGLKLSDENQNENELDGTSGRNVQIYQESETGEHA